MTLPKNPSDPRGADSTLRASGEIWSRVRSPGLLRSSAEIERLTEELPKKLAALLYRKKKPFLWVVFMGGTGTGKSTIFNALCGVSLSETGVERPKTYGPIVYAHRSAPIEENFPFPSIAIRRAPAEGPAARRSGTPGEFLVLEHDREELSHLAFVDTPDLDSLEIHNRRMAEDLYLLSDVALFVTSQEKYADEIPFQFLKQIHEEGKSYFLLLNKADPSFTRDDAPAAFRAQGLSLYEKRLWLLPYAPSNPEGSIIGDAGFQDFRKAFFKVLAKSERSRFLREELRTSAWVLDRRLQVLLDLLGRERQAAADWLNQLELIFAQTTGDLIEEQHRRFTVESREYLQEEIRRLFGKYDVLGRPRRALSRIVKAPLRALGLIGEDPSRARRDVIARIRERIDLAPVRAAVDSFNLAVLEKLPPLDESSPLYIRLRQPSLPLSPEEIRLRVWEEQDRLVSWLEETFRQLARGIPKSKEWGIYSTSILWGAVILLLEAAIGGGITLMEALLDSAVAPLVTKGAMELFAYHEIQKVARELAARYQEGMLSVLGGQRDRCVEALMKLMTPRETLEELRTIQNALRKWEEDGKGEGRA